MTSASIRSGVRTIVGFGNWEHPGTLTSLESAVENLVAEGVRESLALDIVGSVYGTGKDEGYARGYRAGGGR